MLTRKKAAALLAAISILFTLILPAFAAGTVVYTDAREIEILPGDQKPLGLFGHYTKDLMPGETVTFRILVRNSGKIPVNLYLKAADPDDATYELNDADKELSKALLREMPMHIDLVDGDAKKSLFDGFSDGTSGSARNMREFISLGISNAGSERYLEVSVTVPPTLDNTYQKAIGIIDWILRVEETAEESSEPYSEPDTEPHSEPDTEPHSEPDTEPHSEPYTEPHSEPDTEPHSEPDTEPHSEPDTEPHSEPDTEPHSEPGTEPRTEPHTEPHTDPHTEPGTEPSTEPRTESTTGPRDVTTTIRYIPGETTTRYTPRETTTRYTPRETTTNKNYPPPDLIVEIPPQTGAGNYRWLLYVAGGSLLAVIAVFLLPRKKERK
ncbi:MAG: hypothetical protein K6G90_07250 [Clostridia bacterium]|nr:hypothetical protein [Clostridia bacterium]